MRYTIETLSDKSLSEFRVLCQLKRGNFACFDLPHDEAKLIDYIADIDRLFRDKMEDIEVVFIPIQVFLNKTVSDIFNLSGLTEWIDFIYSIGLFNGAKIVLYNPGSFGMNIEL